MKSCPFCGTGNKVRIVTAKFIVSGEWEATACCENCGKFTSAHQARTEAEAVGLAKADWNTRAGDR